MKVVHRVSMARYNCRMPEFISLKKAVSLVSDGSVVFIGGSGITNNPMAFCREMIRQKKSGIHFLGVNAGLALDMLASENVVEKAEIAACDLGAAGEAVNFDLMVEQQVLKVEDYSALSMIKRFIGGQNGTPFVPVKSMIASDIEDKTNLRPKKGKSSLVECPFTGESVCLVPSINPDFAVIYGKYADKDGNAVVTNLNNGDIEGFKAAEVKIVLVEDVGDRDSVKGSNLNLKSNELIIPSFMINYIVRSPRAAWPTSGGFRHRESQTTADGLYYADFEHLGMYKKMSEDEETWQDYKEKFILPSEEKLNHV